MSDEAITTLRYARRHKAAGSRKLQQQQRSDVTEHRYNYDAMHHKSLGGRQVAVFDELGCVNQGATYVRYGKPTLFCRTLKVSQKSALNVSLILANANNKNDY